MVESMESRVLLSLLLVLAVAFLRPVDAQPRRLLLDADCNTDDIFAIIYLLKQNRSEFDIKAITISANSWSDAGHSVNHIYDLLHMMNRDDIVVGVGGDGGITDDCFILPNVGGFLPLIEQGMSTAGHCRYRQAIPKGQGGRLDVDANYGLRRAFLPQSNRRFVPLLQPTAQQVLINTVSAGPTTLILTGSLTNIAVFFMTYPQLKANIEHLYIMGGGVRSENPSGCCPQNSSSSCVPTGECGQPGNLFSAYFSNPYAEFNIFLDPLAAYEVFHSGIPITLIPLDATNTIPITQQFLDAFQQQQNTYEAQYVFQTLKIIRDTSLDYFYSNYFMWDSFASGVAVSSMLHGDTTYSGNDFSDLMYLNITVITSNKPYGVHDGSNPLFDGCAAKFNLTDDNIHSGHAMTRVDDPFCIEKGSNAGICQDGYTQEVTGPEAVSVLVAQKAKPNPDPSSPLDRAFYIEFLNTLNLPMNSGRFNFATKFPYHRETLYKPDFGDQASGKPVVFDMDMSAGDFIALIYLLKVPVEVINLKGILVSANGWANSATIDVIYDVLHMMGRDDIPVGLGNDTALGTPILGCKYLEAIPYGSGGLIDSDSLYGFARTLPRSPRRYTVEKSVKNGDSMDTDHPELRQSLALEVWNSIFSELGPGEKITILTNGPLTNIANIILLNENANSVIQTIYIVGGLISDGQSQTGNLFSVPANMYAEFNMFLDPLAAKTVIESGVDITLVPLGAQHKVMSFNTVLASLQVTNMTPEAMFAQSLLSFLFGLQHNHPVLYQHVDMYLGELLGAVLLSDSLNLSAKFQVKQITVLSTGNVTTDGQIVLDQNNGKNVQILDEFDIQAYYNQLSSHLNEKKQSAVIASFDEQEKLWSRSPS